MNSATPFTLVVAYSSTLMLPSDVPYNAANNKLAKLCEKIDSVRKSPHKLRKTCLSALLDNPNVNNRTVQRNAGHGDITTTLRYYNFDRSSKEEQAKAINDALLLK